MGTSNSYGGPGGGTPLVPSWLGSGEDGAPPQEDRPSSILQMPTVPLSRPIPPAAATNRFTAARNNFSRFASSRGRNRVALGRAVSRYVSTSMGGSQTAAQHMGASRTVGAQLLNFLSSAIANGSQEALRSLNLENLAGRPIQDIFLGLVDYICPNGGTIDEGIAREAFVETIVDLAEAGITDMDSLTIDQMQTIFELYATNAIEIRLCNDIGANIIILPTNVQDVTEVQSQLHDFIYRSVSDALTAARAGLQALTPTLVQGFVNRIYEQVFGILQSLGQVEEGQ